jgi:competence protein ComEC
MQFPFLRTDQDGTITIRSDGKHWEVASQGGITRGPPDGAAKKQVEHSINPNTALVAELELLPGIGPALARHIIAGRPYRAVEDLLRVEGIGERRMAEIRRHVTVR